MMADPAFPTRQYPYRHPDPAAGPAAGAADPGLDAVDASGPDLLATASLAPGTLHRFILGVDPAPRPVAGEELEALGDPFAALLRQGRFPLTLRALLTTLDEPPPVGGALPVQDLYMVGDGGQLPWTPQTAGVSRQLRVVVARSRTTGAEPDLLVSTSTAFDSETAFLQVIGWDDRLGVFRYYERRLGTWILAGGSFDALAEPSRGRGPFDSHVNGSLVMKELEPPWSHWHSQSATIHPAVLAPDDPFRNDPIWNSRKGGEVFEINVARPGVFRWTQSRLDQVIDRSGAVARLPELMRQVLVTTTVNLVSAATQSDLVGQRPALELPTTFFVDLDAFLGPLELQFDPPILSVSGPAYAAARTALGLRLDDGAGFTRPGETFFAFLVPERALEDQAVVEALVQREVLSRRLATCLLMVDFPNPVYSRRRASLLAYVPETIGAGDGGAALDRSLPAAIEAGATTQDGAEVEFLAWWRGSDEPDFPVRASQRLLEFLAACQRRLDGLDGAVDLLRLAQGRRLRFRRSTLGEFALTVPHSPDDDTHVALRLHEDGSVA
ncbi:MAG: hypothetical protein ACRDYA_21000 [Egibacteraceae bacterium]